MFIMLLQATIARKYFEETQTYVASFGPTDLSLIFWSGMGLEVTMPHHSIWQNLESSRLTIIQTRDGLEGGYF